MCPLWGMLIVEEAVPVCVGVGDIWDISVLCTQFCCDPKGVPKIKSIKNASCMDSLGAFMWQFFDI